MCRQTGAPEATLCCHCTQRRTCLAALPPPPIKCIRNQWSPPNWSPAWPQVGRAYGRVSRRKLRAYLLELCSGQNVAFLDAEVTAIDAPAGATTTGVTCSNGGSYRSRLVTLASGAAAGRFLAYEADAPVVAAQTAYGIEAEVEGYGGAYDPSLMLFMDFRRHHTGLHDETALKLRARCLGLLRPGRGRGRREGACCLALARSLADTLICCHFHP